MVRKTARLLLFCGLAFFVILAVGGQLLLRSPAVARWTVEWAAERFAAAMPNASLAIGAVEGDFVSGVMIRGLELRAADRPVLTVARIFCSFDTLGLLVGFVHMPVVEVVGAEIATRLPARPDAGPSEMRIPLPLLGRIDRFVLRDCRLRSGGELGAGPMVDAEGSGGFSLLSLRGWQAWGTVDNGGIRLQDRSIAFRLQRLRLAAGQPLQWLGLRLQSGESVLHLDGRLDAARRLRLAWRTPGLRPADFTGNVALQLVGEGSLSSLPAASLQTANVGQYLPWSRLAVRFAGTVDGRRLQISGILAGLPSAPAWEGVLAVQGWSGADLRRMLAAGGEKIGRAVAAEDWPEISGLAARLYLHYRPNRPLQGSLSVQEMTLAGLAVQGSARFLWRGKRLLLRDVECSSPVGRLWEGEGVFRSRAKWRFSARFAGETQKLLAAAAASSSGVLTGLPARLSGQVRLAAGQKGLKGELSFAPVTIDRLGRAEATFVFRLEKDGLAIDRGTVASDVASLSVRGRLGKRAARLRFAAGLPDVGKIFSALNGGMEISGTLEGNYDHPRLAAMFHAAALKGAAGMGEEIEGSVVMADLFQSRSAAVILSAGRLQVAGREVHGLRLALHPISRGWQLTQLEGKALDRSWRLQAPVRVIRDKGEGPAVWRIEGLSLSAADGTVVRLQGERRPDATLSAEVAVEGKSLLPLPLTAAHTRLRVSLSAPPLSVGRFSFTIDGRYQGRPVQIQGTGRRPASEPLEAEIGVLLAGRQVARFAGSVPLAALRQKGAWRQVVGKLHLQELPLDLLPPSWLAGRCAGGVLSADLRADGRGAVSGEVELSDTQCRVDVLGLTFTGLSAKVAAADDGQTLRLEEGRLHTAAGEIGVRGAVSLPCRLDLALSTEDVGFVFHSRYQGRAGFALTLTGQCAEPTISGAIWPASRVVRRLGGETEPAGGDVAVFESRTPTGASQPAAAEPRLPVSLDCRIELPDKGLRFEAEGISLDLSGWFRARIAADGSRYDGRLRILRGEYAVYRRQCVITQGELRFAGKSSFDPDLSAQAECRLPGVTITAYAGGTIHEPDIILESDPWMSEEDIKATLIFGKPFAALSESQRETYQAAALASLLGSSVLDRFADMTGYESLVDSFSFYTRDNGEGGQGVAVDAFLTRNLRLGYAYEFGEQAGGKVRMEYMLQGGLSVESLYSEQGEDTGFDLIWRRDF